MKLAALSFSLLAFNASAVEMYCAKSGLKNGFNLSLNTVGGAMASKGSVCIFKNAKYNPVSDRYKNWSRIAPTTECKKLGSNVVGNNAFGEGLDVHWISISPEVRSGYEGFVQLGFENDTDPGAGATAKAILRCFPRK